LSRDPCDVDRFFIDGTMNDHELRYVIPEPGPSLAAPCPGGKIYFESPKNPHAGCFVLSCSQLRAWERSENWQDGDSTFVSPLESAATLGISKNFILYKPVMAMASWLEIQHWGCSFHSLLGNTISLPSQSATHSSIDNKVEDQSEN